MYKAICIIFLVAAHACTSTPGNKATQAENAHQHAGTTSQHTLYSDQIEFFIEHEAMEAGKETEIMIHLTALDTYKPCTDGNVTVSIDGVSVTSGRPGSPGIFTLPFTPKKGGAFHAEFVYKNDILTASAEAHIDIYRDHESAHSNESAPSGHSHESAPVGEITFQKEQAWTGGFMVEKVLPGPFHSVIPTSGELVPMPGEKKNIPATIRGMIRFADPQLVQGSHVERGKLLFSISSESLVEDNVKLRFEAARNKLEKSRSEYQRHKRLYTREAISQRQYQESRSNYVEDSLHFYNLESHISDEGIQVLAPASGSLHELLVSDGMYVSEGSNLAILSPDQNLLLRADLPQQYYSSASSISSAHFRTAYSEHVYSVEEMKGALLTVGHSVKENDHYLPVNFLLENNGELLEGAYAEVYLIAGERSEVLTVPATALGEEQGGKYVFVQFTGESYSKRRVITGSSDGLRVEILSGLQAGDRVVTSGLMLVKAASLDTGEISDGHSH